MINETQWFLIDRIDAIESPGLIFYEERIRENINRLLGMINQPRRLRPHVKTHKSADVTKLLLQAGIHKFKCATIAEAEMLGVCGAPDVLLAYQPVGPNISRYIALQHQFPNTRFSCLVDQEQTAIDLAAAGKKKGYMIRVYLDVNVGMNRTGVLPEEVIDLYGNLNGRKGLELMGLHAYDGHIHESDLSLRQSLTANIIVRLKALQNQIETIFKQQAIIIAGGTPTFPIFSEQTDFECSPGTFILWDHGYQQAFKEQEFLTAALVVSRVISLPSEGLICTDLGHKAVSAENPLDKRVRFINAPDLQPKSQSEEHLVLAFTSPHQYKVGDVLYGLPFHICPTVALYEHATCIAHGQPKAVWPINSRKRKISI